ncbi:hypothetical protein QYM36_012444 [Artemia franciscana]|uniref:Proline dehydrogenase n=1 Tax=Artemia franciscana TaxID=6661 RepID=A0AA88HKT5_ARTSF|nr:hypothetical protein QYM36_012444 [Artemia franciscana]
MALRGSVKNSLKFRAINGACRFRSSQAASFACETHNVIDEPESKKSYSQLDTSFTDTVAAYKSKSFSELLRSYLVFSLCSSSTLVENNMKLMKLGKAVLGKKLFEKLMRATFYGQFVAGKDQAEIKPVIDKNYMFGVKSILDYSAEEDISEEEAKAKEMAREYKTKNLNKTGNISSLMQYKFSETVTSSRPSSESSLDSSSSWIASVSMARHVVAIINLSCHFAELSFSCHVLGVTVAIDVDYQDKYFGGHGLQLSETIMRARQYFSDVTKVDITGNIMAKHVSPKLFERRFKEADISVDNPEIQKWLKQMTYDKEGLINLFSWSGLIDANILLSELFKVPNLKTGKLEPIISALTEEEEEMFFNMMRRLNSIFEERERAKVLGYADPINPSYEATSAMYEKCLSAGLQKIQEYKPVTDEKRVAVMVASHNEDTVKYTVEKMQEYGIEREDKVVCFGQLLGMCDHISFPLGQSGYSVYKYVPYGPVDEVLPYLSRRAQENRGVITKIKKEKNLLFSEIRRRVKSGQVLYDPLKAIN